MSEQKIEYLYVMHLGGGLSRYKIIRESKAYYFTEYSKISKKSMKEGKGYQTTYYTKQTPELDKSYQRQKCSQMGIKMLGTLRNRATQKWVIDHYEEIKKLYESLNREIGEQSGK